MENFRKTEVYFEKQQHSYSSADQSICCLYTVTNDVCRTKLNVDSEKHKRFKGNAKSNGMLGICQREEKLVVTREDKDDGCEGSKSEIQIRR